MIALTVILLMVLAGVPVLLYIKRRSFGGVIKNLFHREGNTNAESKKPITDPDYTNILQERYTKGEVSEDKYEKMKNDLG
jgi:uncharacterized membrane protein